VKNEMVVDQILSQISQKSLNLIDEMQKNEILEKFMKSHPEMVLYFQFL